MKAVKVVGYNQKLEMSEAPEPQIEHPLDVIVKIGAAGVCRFVICWSASHRKEKKKEKN